MIAPIKILNETTQQQQQQKINYHRKQAKQLIKYDYSYYWLSLISHI